MWLAQTTVLLTINSVNVGGGRQMQWNKTNGYVYGNGGIHITVTADKEFTWEGSPTELVRPNPKLTLC